MVRRSIVLSVCVLTTLATSVAALITGDIGDKPVHDAGWPKGAVELANSKSRIAWWEGPPFGGGQFQFLYRGDTEAFQAALDLFARMRTPRREVVIHDGPEESWYLKIDRGSEKKVDPRIDWTFTVWIPASWHRLYNAPNSAFFSEDPNFGKPLPPPRIDVYVGGEASGKGIDWSKVKVPQNVTVKDERAAAAGVKPVGGAVVHVNAYDMATGKPVEGAVLQVNQRDAQGNEVAKADTNADGFAAAQKIPAGVYRLSLSAPGYATRVIAYEELSASDYRSYDIELSSAATMSGTVVDSEGKPIANANVRANAMGIDGRGYSQPERLQATTDAHGRFELTGLPTGYAQLRVYAKGHAYGDFMKVHRIPSSDLTLRMGDTGSIRGKVTGEDGKAAPGARNIFIVPAGGPRVGMWSASGNLAADGGFEFSDVPVGTYYAAVKPFEGAPEEREDAVKIEVTKEKTAEVIVKVK